MSPPSILNSRYLPRRTIPRIFFPSSLDTKWRLLGWRRIDRIPPTSTCLMRLPTTSFSRSRRSVSTSGSSGIGSHLASGESAPRFLGGRLLGLLLRASRARAVLVVAQVDGGEEALGVI